MTLEQDTTYDNTKELNTRNTLYLSDEVPTTVGSDSMGTITSQKLENNTAKNKTRKKQQFLSNPSIRRWYENLARKSLNTANAYQRRLRLFCEYHQMSPMELAEIGMKDPKAVSDLLIDHIAMMERKPMKDGRIGHSPQTMTGVIKVVKSWMREFDVEIKRKINVKNATSTPTLENEKLPTAEEMEELISRSPLRTALIIAFENQGGLRPEVLGNAAGDNGLRIKNLPDIAIVKGLAVALRTPPMVIVPKTLSKAGHEYMTFLTPTATSLLITYLNDRILSGDVLGPDSPVIAQSKHCKIKKKSPFLTTPGICKVVSDSTRPRFTEWRSNYGHRRFFDVQMIISEGQNKVSHNFVMFWMGHSGDIESTYTTNKGILPPRLVDEMRAAFNRCVEILDFRYNRKEDELTKQKDELKTKISSMSTADVQMLLRVLGDGKSSSVQTMRSRESEVVGNMLETFQAGRSS